ncbi:MAG TPA: ATP-dependent DNA helicase RecQ [Vicinamibacterales bacterium]|nr:ATP-dependent DNA helicase RecQ [Vicinamibacterales bacterium]
MAPVSSPLDLLHRYFGHAALRPPQVPIVEAAMAGDDVLAVMPTGSGKSLCFQLPALALPGLTLVVSPLISLMKDQVDELVKRGVGAAALHSGQTPDERRDTLRRAHSGALRLLYVAPERFGSDHFLSSLHNWPVARFVVDEAHCVSEWGHDFRPDYRRLADAADACHRCDDAPGRPPVLAFTATATPEVRDDIVSLLGMREPKVFVAGFDRPNIELRVRPVSGDREKRTLLPELVGGRRSLVYASTRRSAEDASETLVQAGIAAAAYHAGLSDTERTRVQDAFADGKLQVVCATNAFGMGIDRPDLEVVVHKELPASVEAYYQEVGRVGRDGRQSVATLLWNYVDVKTREFLIDKRDEDDGRDAAAEPAEQDRRRALEHLKLKRMVAYADGTGCLRMTILRYFGDPDAGADCQSCGNCLKRVVLTSDQLLLVRKILSGVARAGERWGRRKIAAMLTGQTEELPDALVALSTTGLLGEHDPKLIEKWIDALVGSGALISSADIYRTLRLSSLGREVMAGRQASLSLLVPTVRVKAPGSRARKTKGARGPATLVSTPLDGQASEPDESVLNALRAWRRDEARTRAVPAYVVLHDKTIDAIARERPRSAADLGEISGIGPAKLAAYGEAILRVLSPDNP